MSRVHLPHPQRYTINRCFIKPTYNTISKIKMIAKEENKVKRLLNMIVVLAMIVSLQMPALATGNASAIPTRSAPVQDEDIEISDETANRIATFLTSIIGDETGYGLSTVDFNSLQYIMVP